MLPWVHSILGDGIFGWSGSIAAIPRGFRLCDGTEGTPDLRDKFLVCSGPGDIVGGMGGAETHPHNIDHGLHNHIIGIGTAIPWLAGKHATVVDESITATTGATNSKPPYFALAYLMDVGEA